MIIISVPLIPHVGGLIFRSGIPTVLIANIPAANNGTIVVGCPTVMICGRKQVSQRVNTRQTAVQLTGITAVNMFNMPQ
jgi:uncharacterized Zn-binding protein involved in type VI secretion